MPERWQVQIHRKVNDVVYALPGEIVTNIRQAIRQLEQNPYQAESRLVSSFHDVFEIFVERCRIVYEVKEDKKLVRVVRIDMAGETE